MHDIDKTADSIEAWLIAYLAQRLDIDASEIERNKPFAEYGLASIEGISLIKDLETWLNYPLAPTLAWDYPTIDQLIQHLASNTLRSEKPLMSDMLSVGESEPIAIIGMGCRFPGAANLDAFWELLCNPQDVIREVPRERWDADAYYDPNQSQPGKMVSRWGGFIDQLELFDASFFGISPREAAQLDPRQRLTMELAWEALEDAGIPPLSLAGSKTGVFMANLTANYAALINDHPEIVDAYFGTGNGNSVLANRVSYFLDLRGPSLSLDTACSGSLVALHLGCTSLRTGETNLAIVGGVNIILKPGDSIFFSKTGALSPDGRCKVFDKRANGIVRSDGAGIVILKPLKQALADHDQIYAVIRGSAVNQDGGSNGILAPNRQAQEDMLREAYQRAGIHPGTVQYIEAHGTGTALGDPIEVNALGAVLTAERPAELQCALGSVKTLIGHTEAAAGIAGIIKTALMIKHRVIPSNLHFEEPNPLIPFDQLPFYVPQELGSWPDEQRPLTAGVSGFGFAGTNAHMVLQEPPALHQQAPARSLDACVLPVSARSMQALQELAQAYQTQLNTSLQTSTLYDLCYTASLHRSNLEYRLAVTGATHAEIIEQLDVFLQGEPRQGVSFSPKRVDRQPGCVFVFSGQGSHWFNMGQQLLAQEPVFRAALTRCDQLLQQHTQWSLLEELAADNAQSRLNETDRAQPAIFAIQVALAALWRSWNIVPQRIVGQSLGEIAAAHVAGVLSLEDAIKVVYERSRLMKQLEGKGRTAVVALPLEKARLILTGFDDVVSVAGSNSPSMSVLSGDGAALERIIGSLERQNIYARMLKGVDIAFHSVQMEPLKAELIAALATIKPFQAKTPLVSTVTGKFIEGTQMDAAYWGANLREPFLFTEAIQLLIKEGTEVFLEVSPHPVLAAAVTEGLNHSQKKGLVVASMQRNENEWYSLCATLGTLYTHGFNIDWQAIYPHGTRLKLPTYAWQRDHYWYSQLLETTTQQGTAGTAKQSQKHPFLGDHLLLAHPPGHHVWEMDINAATYHYLEQHRVQGAVVFPGAAYLEVALAAAQQALGPAVYALEQVSFKQAFVLPQQGTRRLQINLVQEHNQQATFHVFSAALNADGEVEQWLLHARGSIRAAAAEPAHAPDPIQAIMERCNEVMSSKKHYDLMTARGLQYGPSFQAIDQIWRRDGEALGRLQLPETVQYEAAKYLIHPVLLDACFQMVALTAPGSTDADATPEMRLPVGATKVTLFKQPAANIWCYAHLRDLTQASADTLESDVYLVDDAGTLVGIIEGFQLQRIATTPQSGTENINDWFYSIEWHPKPHHVTNTGISADYLAELSTIVEQVQPLAPALGATHELDHYEQSLHDFEVLSAIYVGQALHDLGWDMQPGQQRETQQLITQLNIVAQHHQLFERLLEIMAEEGVLQRDQQTWTVVQTTHYPEIDALSATLVDKYPLSKALLQLVQRCGQALADVLRGQADPLQLLFGGTFDIVETFYTTSPYFQVYNTMIAESIRTALEQMPADRTVRILEIGAGTGSTTSYILPLLPAERIEYVFTDVSTLFTAKAEEKFAAYPFMRYQLLDIEQQPETQGLQAHEFDIIVASNVLHATGNLRQVLNHVQSLIAPDGLLVLLESPGPQRWIDITFGLTEGWWKFTDKQLRQAYPLLAQHQWIDLLQEVGFRSASGMTDGRSVTPQYIVLARAAALASDAQPEALRADSQHWLILADSSVGTHVAEELGKRGAQCIVVSTGTEYTRLTAQQYQVNPEQPADYMKLLQETTPAEGWQGIVHLWSLDVAETAQLTPTTLAQAQVLTSMSLTGLIQAYTQTTQQRAPRLWLITRGAQPAGLQPEALAVAQAPIIGIGRVLLMEHPELRTTMVDLDPQLPEQRVEHLITELLTNDAETQVAFRDQARKVGRLVQIQGLAPAQQAALLRPDATYLITGGLSGIGLEVARWMATHGARRLILLARTQLPPREQWDQLDPTHPAAQRITAVRELEAQGVSVYLGALDVGDPEQLSRFLEQYKREAWPPIRGVVHSAGLIKDLLLMRMDQETFELVSRPKIMGSWMLATLLKDDPLDFFLLFSSATSIMGMFGQSNYAAGNAFVDALAHYMRAQGRPAISVNWGVWADVGIIARSELKDQLAQDGLLSIRPEQGIEIIERLLKHQPVQVAPMPTDWTLWRQTYPMAEKVPVFSLLPTAQTHEKTVVAGPGSMADSSFTQALLLQAPQERQHSIETYFTEMVAGVLRLDRSRIDLDQPLNTMGLDSIMAVEIKGRIEGSLGISISIVELLQGTSINNLTDHVLASLSQEDAELEALLAEVEQLPLEDVQSLLNSN